MKLWRIAADTPDYTADDVSGKGAEFTGGRWNREGTPLLYTSTSRALACLETFAHLNAGAKLPLNRYLVEIDIPDKAWQERAQFGATDFIGWDAEPAGKVSLDWGTEWVRELTTLMAGVPSLIVAEESNVLINPAHPDAAAVTCEKIRKWLFDPRLMGT